MSFVKFSDYIFLYLSPGGGHPSMNSLNIEFKAELLYMSNFMFDDKFSTFI